MDPLTVIVLVVALFVAFLMLTAGQRKHRLEQALQGLEKERLRLLKSIEHVKLSFYQKKLDDKEAQDKIFEYEEKLREVQSKILDLKEKPMLRTLENQKATEKVSSGGTDKEKAEIERSERFMLAHTEAKTVFILFVLIIVIIIVAVTMMGKSAQAGDEEVYKGPETVRLYARTFPTDGAPPGSRAGLRVEISNPHDEDIFNIILIARPPDGSGITIREDRIGVEQIKELESGGMRDVFFEVDIAKNTPDGDYVIYVEATNEYNLESSTEAKLLVRVGAKEENV